MLEDIEKHWKTFRTNTYLNKILIRQFSLITSISGTILTVTNYDCHSFLFNAKQYLKNFKTRKQKKIIENYLKI